VTGTELATRQALRLDRDPSRVVADLFVPGHALPGQGGRASQVVDQVRSLDDHEVELALAGIGDRFGHRHRDLVGTLRRNADRVRNRLAPGEVLREDRWLLLGATFTQEVAVEGAAVCNPSAVEIDGSGDQAAGSMRFLLSVRQIGEGHRSSIGFRTGTVDRDGSVAIDERSPHATTGTTEAAELRAGLLRDRSEASAWVLDRLGPRFTVDDLEARLVELSRQRDTRRGVEDDVARLRSIAARTYTTTVPAASTVAERVLHPATATESNGVEDARFVRVVGDDWPSRYCATYTAYDGVAISQQLLTTDDFLTFTSSPLLGVAAANKGLALFPRTIDGEYHALTRHDGANNAVARSSDLDHWSSARPIDHPRAPWETVQVGNCGSPIETDRGWLVLTHGVGPMRTYSIGAWLLDLDDPSRLLGHLPAPLLAPSADEQDGYVPNVVYSCGALLHGDHLVLPYGIGDASIGFATASLPEVLDRMTR
jgi:predicted GH43/DUF377 family glycosyl hydrolase